MAFLDKTGLQNLTNKLVQGDVIKVASSKGTTVKEVIDNIKRECESVALPNNMILENRVNQFVVGQSRDMDVSRDIEEGLSKIQLQGKTYQNLITFKSKTYNDDYPRVYFKRNIDLKPNTTYTFITPNFDSSKNAMYIGFNGSKQLLGYQKKYIGTFTTSADMKNVESGIYFFYNGKDKQDFVRACPTTHMLLEGDYSQIPTEELPQYFEGIKSSFEDKVANITVQGKNFFDVSKLTAFKVNNVNIFWSGDKLLLNGAINSTWTSFATSNSLPKGTYSLRVYDKGVYWGGKAKIWGYNSEGQLIANVGNGTTFTIEEDAFNIKLVIEGFQSGTMIDAELTIQIERAAKFTPYEPYYHYNYKFDIKEPLRRLPNDVCDEIRNNNGKWELVRRINKIIIDHTVDFNKEAQHNNTIRFYSSGNFTTKYKIKTSSHGLCDKVPFLHGDSNDVFHCRFDGSFPYATLKIWIDKNKLNSEDEQGLKAWLQANPIIVYGELAEPIITPIDPIEFNVSQGTTININSDITPISTHEVILNRSGQVEQGIELIADLRSRIDKLEKAYDSNLIATQYRLNNLKLNYELEREED